MIVCALKINYLASYLDLFHAPLLVECVHRCMAGLQLMTGGYFTSLYCWSQCVENRCRAGIQLTSRGYFTRLSSACPETTCLAVIP